MKKILFLFAVMLASVAGAGLWISPSFSGNYSGNFSLGTGDGALTNNSDTLYWTGSGFQVGLVFLNSTTGASFNGASYVTNTINSQVVTNFPTGTTYQTNNYGKNIIVQSDAALTCATIAGQAQLSLEVPGVRTNRSSVPTTVAAALAGTVVTNAINQAVVAPGGTYRFVNTSSGAGNSAASTAGLIIIVN